MFNDSAEEKPESMRMRKLKDLVEELQMLMEGVPEAKEEPPTAAVVIAEEEPKA